MSFQGISIPGTRGGKITAELASIDTGEKVTFKLPPSEHTREMSATWDEPGVAEADPQPIEYRTTHPETRTYEITLDGEAIASSVEGEIAILKKLQKRAPGKVRAHKCVYTQGIQRFRCVLESVRVRSTRIGASGGIMQAEVSIGLKEIAR